MSGAWTHTISERFLKPIGIPEKKFFTWSQETLEDIHERNDHMSRLLGLDKSDFILPRKHDGPFMVRNANANESVIHYGLV